MAIYTITIERWHPARINQWDGKHWSVRAKLKRADAAMVETYCRAASLPKATTRRRVTLHIVLGPRQRGGDPDAYWKSLLDALVHAGALVDDGKEWVETPPATYSRGKQHATVITLEDL